MNPAWSVIGLTVSAGIAQGMVLVLALAVLLGATVPPDLQQLGLLVAGVLLIVGLASSFAHLGRPERAWRAVLMWKTSWLSREVLALPAFIAIVFVWLGLLRFGSPAAHWHTEVAVMAVVFALVLWCCTAMIYACLRFIQEWAHPFTLVNFAGIGLASGLLWLAALAAMCGQMAWATKFIPAAMASTALAMAVRLAMLVRNAKLSPKSTLQSATGIQAKALQQKSMGMSAGAFNTREFFHRCSPALLKHLGAFMLVTCYVLPCCLLSWSMASGSNAALVLAALVQVPGLLAERWLFFAQARHPQNLYYQVVS